MSSWILRPSLRGTVTQILTGALGSHRDLPRRWGLPEQDGGDVKQRAFPFGEGPYS